GEHARAADLVAPDRLHVGDARALDRILQLRRAHDREVARMFVGRALRGRSEDDRIVAIVDRLDFHHRRLPDGAAVEAGPFTERTLGLLPVAVAESLEYDLRVRGKRQARHLAENDVHRLAAVGTDDVVLAEAVGYVAPRHQKRERIDADDHASRHRLTSREILIAVPAAVLTRRDVEADVGAVVDHRAIRSAIDPIAIGIFRHVEAAGPDVTTAVALVPLRGRELEDVDVRTAQDVLQDRPVFDDAKRDGMFERRLQRCDQRFAELYFVEIRRKPERHVLAPRAEKVREDAKSLREAGNIVEEGGRRVLVVLEELRNHSDVWLARGPIDAPQLAEFFDFGNPFAQVPIRQPVARACRPVRAGSFRRG